MKKSSKIIFIVAIILLLIVMGVGGYFLAKSIKDSNDKISSLENQIELLKNDTDTKNELSSETKKDNELVSNNENSSSQKSKTDIANEAIRKALKDDEWINKNFDKANNGGTRGNTFIKIANINEMPAYLVYWKVWSADDPSEKGGVVYIVSYDGEKVIVSENPLNPYVDFGSEAITEVSTKKNYVVTSSAAEGDSIVYAIEGTKFKQIAKSVYDAEANSEEDSMKYFNADGKKISAKQFMEYKNELKEIDINLNDANIDRYVK